MSRRGGLTPEERRRSLIADIDALPGPRRNERAGAVRVDADFLLAPYSVIRQAARDRRMTTQSYVRRAAYAMACHDLGLPLLDVLAMDPRAARDNGFGVSDPDGSRFGLWEIEKLRGEPDATER